MDVNEELNFLRNSKKKNIFFWGGGVRGGGGRVGGQGECERRIDSKK